MSNAATINPSTPTLPLILTKNSLLFSYNNTLFAPPSNKWRQKHSTNSMFHLISNPRPIPVRCSTSEAAREEINPKNQDSEGHSGNDFWKKWKMGTTKMSSKVAKLGLAAILAYGLFDGITYTSFFILAFTGYEKSTGKNPAANLQALLGIVILMWTGNNITRPFRVAGAAAVAPLIDKGLKRIQKYFRLPSLVFAFALVVTIVAALCLTIVGLLILSRWGK